MLNDRKQHEAEQIVEKLHNNKHVSRWDILKRQYIVLDIIQNNEKYNYLEDEVLLTIEMAKESL